jgi:hypothetical protein
MGMGDHILCNAIIRTYAEKYDKVYLFVKPHNIENVLYMYRDLTNFKPIALDDKGVQVFRQLNPNYNYLIVGITPEWFHNFDVLHLYETFDHGFYAAANVPFEDKWNKFYFERDIEKEKHVFYNVLGLKDSDEFLFVHDDPERDRKFKENLIPKGIEIINPGRHKDVKLFDFIYTIEKAKEVHVMNSSFSCLIDTMQIKTNKLFFHEYARTDMGDNPNHKMKLNWNIIK